MAEYKVVNATQLDADMASVADTIRTKGGTTEELAWPEGFKSAIEGIESGGGHEVEDALIAGTLTEYTNDRVTVIYQYTFAEKKNLQSVSFPNVEAVGQYAFSGASNLTDLNFPKLKTAEFYGFSGIGAKSVRFPNVTWVNNRGLANCPNLVLADFPRLATITANGFLNSKALSWLVLRNQSDTASLGNSALNGTPIAAGAGFVLAPRVKLASYREGTNWSALAPEQFLALEDYTVDGTITGELDLEKMGVTL